jgi:hypothetical protein
MEVVSDSAKRPLELGQLTKFCVQNRAATVIGGRPSCVTVEEGAQIHPLTVPCENEKKIVEKRVKVDSGAVVNLALSSSRYDWKAIHFVARGVTDGMRKRPFLRSLAPDRNS